MPAPAKYTALCGLSPVIQQNTIPSFSHVTIRPNRGTESSASDPPVERNFTDRSDKGTVPIGAGRAFSHGQHSTAGANQAVASGGRKAAVSSHSSAGANAIPPVASGGRKAAVSGHSSAGANANPPVASGGR